MRLAKSDFGVDSFLDKTGLLKLENNSSNLHENFFLHGILHQLHQVYRDFRSDCSSFLSRLHFALRSRFKDSSNMNATIKFQIETVEHPTETLPQLLGE